jgi:hypothetical protein
VLGHAGEGETNPELAEWHGLDGKHDRRELRPAAESNMRPVLRSMLGQDRNTEPFALVDDGVVQSGELVRLAQIQSGPCSALRWPV